MVRSPNLDIDVRKRPIEKALENRGVRKAIDSL